MSFTDEAHTEFPGESRAWWERHRDEFGVALCSLGLHLALLIALALVVIPIEPQDATQYLTIRTEVVENPPLETVENLKITPPKLNNGKSNDRAAARAATDLISDQPSPVSIDQTQQELQWKVEALEYLGTEHKFGELAGRTTESRTILLRAFGGTATTEAAVASGLKWLKEHQFEDGSWSFDHRHDKCDETCADPGNLRNGMVGATAMAMLCYLGAGHTHQTGTYQPEVLKGLDYLRKIYHEQVEPGDMRGITSGTSGMYTHALVTITFCELFALTRDRTLAKMAQKCVDFIIDSQHPQDGGWRYQPQESPGDTSVVGWQVMALTSARQARLTVPGRAQILAERFLDSVQLEEGAYYGYTQPERKASTTAIGLLCRMYYGWDEHRLPLRVGVKYLSEVGPSRDNQYFNYYATQVLHHWGGREWDRWNRVMREELVSTQAKTGHAAGSWTPRDPHGGTGGRHYMTCLSILTLEVYYRHLPLYQRRQLQADF